MESSRIREFKMLFGKYAILMCNNSKIRFYGIKFDFVEYPQLLNGLLKHIWFLPVPAPLKKTIAGFEKQKKREKLYVCHNLVLSVLYFSGGFTL